MKKISAEELKRRITGPGELALIDVREAGAFSRAHLLFAVSVPLSRLELGFAALVPRRLLCCVMIAAVRQSGLPNVSRGSVICGSRFWMAE